MDLSYEFSFSAELGESVPIGRGPYGTRIFASTRGGSAQGERISGTFVGGGGDWVLVGRDGFGRLDVRLQLRTLDGAALYLSYSGVLEMNERFNTAFASGGETQFGDHYYRITPRLETGDDRYDWVNRTVFVGRGRLVPGAVEYEVFRVD